jgi:Ca-activated chloride channel family protein
VFMKIGLEARDVGGRPTRVPVNVAMVLDRSGSMAGEKLDHAKAAARALVNKLGEADRFALVTFGSDVTVAYASSPVTPSAREAMLSAIDSIQDIGGTNLSGGLEAGVAQVRSNAERYGVNRVILCSDGQANEGVVESESLLGMSHRFADEGVKLSTIGLGLDFNEEVMMGLASQGAGSYHYLRDPDQLETIFVSEFNRATQAIASNVEITLAPAPGVRIEQVIGYPSQSQGPVTTIRVPDLSSGEKLKIVVKVGVTASQLGSVDVSQIGLSYTNIPGGRIAEAANVKLAASVTRDEPFALANRDRGVLEEATKAESGYAYMQAAKYLRDGENAKALGLLRDTRRVVQKRNAYVKSADLSKFEKMFDSDEKEVARPMSADDLSNKTKSMSAFGNQAAQE